MIMEGVNRRHQLVVTQPINSEEVLTVELKDFNLIKSLGLR